MSNTLPKTQEALSGLGTEMKKFDATFERIESLRTQADSERQRWEQTGDPAHLQKSASAANEAESLASAVGDVENLKARVRARFFESSDPWQALSEDAETLLPRFEALVKRQEATIAEAFAEFICSGGDPLLRELMTTRVVQPQIFHLHNIAMKLGRLRDSALRLRSRVGEAKNPSTRNEARFFEIAGSLEGIAKALEESEK